MTTYTIKVEATKAADFPVRALGIAHDDTVRDSILAWQVVDIIEHRTMAAAVKWLRKFNPQLRTAKVEAA
jgi:hypothetical protein